MSNRQKNITLTKEQQEYVINHANESIKSMANRFGMSEAKVSMNLKIMGLSRVKERTFECNGFFDIQKFGSFYKF